MCGQSKCFFRDRHDHEVGWVMQEHGNRYIWRWSQAWALGQNISNAYGVRNLNLGPPRVIHLHGNTANYLNEELHWSETRDDLREDRFESGEVVLEPVRRCSWPSCLLLSCGGGTKHHAMMNDLVSFLGRV